MTRQEALQILRENRAGWSPFGVKSLALFGSVARDEAGPQSDVDILVEFVGRATFDRYANLLFFLEEILGCKVDLATDKAIRPRLWPYIKPELVYVS